MADKIYKFKSKIKNLLLLDLEVRFENGYFETADQKLQKILSKRKGIEEISDIEVEGKIDE